MLIQNLMNIVWLVLQVLIGYNLVLPFFLLLFYLLVKPKQTINYHPTDSANEADYAIIVTAYEQTNLLAGVVASILKLNYNNYLIYIVADKCDISNLNFDNEKVILLRPEEVLSSNTRSHFYAINRFKRNHERLAIIDSDNLVDPDFLNAINLRFDQGFYAVQGLREAKNLDTLYACLDAARDIYYHFYDGKLLFTLGSSATLAGSGMAFTTRLYKECLEHQDIIGAGFDKILQKEIVTRGYRIAFAEGAIVNDEKTSKSEQLVNQRARWINTWFKYFSFGFSLVGKGLYKRNLNQFLFGLILLRPPLFIFLILGLLFTSINIFLNPLVALIWILGFVLFIVGFMLSLLINKTSSKIYQSLWGIPKFIYFQVLSLLKVKNANKHSIATKHFHDEKKVE